MEVESITGQNTECLSYLGAFARCRDDLNKHLCQENFKKNLFSSWDVAVGRMEFRFSGVAMVEDMKKSGGWAFLSEHSREDVKPTKKTSFDEGTVIIDWEGIVDLTSNYIHWKAMTHSSGNDRSDQINATMRFFIAKLR